MSDPLPDYYAILEVSPTATADQIRTAYKKAALKWHPDRVPADSPERPRRTKKFQAINDAYYTLSETTRRTDYDESRRWHTGSTTTPGSFEDEDADEEIPRTKPAGSFWDFFTNRAGGQDANFANEQFGHEFEDMMREAGLAEEETDPNDPNARPQNVPTKRFWSIVGAVAGGALGFIVANVVGAIPGAAAGHQLGKIRDQKGKPVYQVFQELDQNSRAKVLSELAAKIFAGAIS